MAREPHTELASKRESCTTSTPPSPPPARGPGRSYRPAPGPARRVPVRAGVHPLDEPTAIGDEALITSLVAAMTRDDLEVAHCKDEADACSRS